MSILIIQNARGQSHQGVILSKKEIDQIIDVPYLVYPRKHFIDCYQSFYILAKYITCIPECNIFVGGDHLTSFGTVLSSLIKYGNRFKLLWIDAHADVHSFETSPTKNLHGMVIRMLLSHTFRDVPKLLPEQILYVGLRSAEKEELDYIKKHKIKYMKDININECLAFCANSPVHISLDIDALNFSSTGTPVPDGISEEQLYQLIRALKFQIFNKLLKRECIFDVMEYNPKISRNNAADISIIKHYIKEVYK